MPRRSIGRRVHAQFKVDSQIRGILFTAHCVAHKTYGFFFPLKLTITCYDFCLQGRIQKIIEVGEIFKKAACVKVRYTHIRRNPESLATCSGSTS